MEMLNKTAYEDLRQVGLAEDQAIALASHLPDWSQFATKQDLGQLRQDMNQDLGQLRQDMNQGLGQLRQDMSRLESRLDQKTSQLESRLVRWMVGIFLTFLALLGGLVTLALNIYSQLG